MPRQAFQPEGRPKPKPPYSPVVVAGDAVYTAGQTMEIEAIARRSR
jgi:enamine deaminase RidA (YjgF/YER057c/UK114 family)